jgi:predicted dehydrogenase
MKQYTFGIVGAGSIADLHAKVITEMDTAVLAGCCDSGSGRAKGICDQYGGAVYTDYQAMMDDPAIDIIAIATPSGFHYEPAIAAAKAHKHVLCEKPLEISLDRIDAMIAAHDQAGTYLGCIFQNRFTDTMLPLRQAIQQGRFGTITHVSMQVPWWRSQDYYDGTWRGTWKLDGGGAMMNQSIHLVDMLIDLMGMPVDIQAYIGTLGHDIEAEDTAVAILRFESGALGSIYGTTASWPGRKRQFEITGTKGTVMYTDTSVTQWQFADSQLNDEQILKGISESNQSGGAADPMDMSHQYHQRNFQAFVDAIDKNIPFTLDGKEARKSVELILRLYKSGQRQ